MGFAGFTHQGAIHDKTMAVDETPDFSLLKKFELWFSKDKTCQASAVNFLEPFKGKKGRALKNDKNVLINGLAQFEFVLNM